jgi:HSP20 family protein
MARQDSSVDRPRVQRNQSDVQRRTNPYDLFWSSPFALMRRMQDEMDRWFGDPSASRGGWTSSGEQGRLDWAPDVDVFQRGTDLVVRADLPGLSKEDLDIEIGDDSLTIRGERRHETNEERDGVYRSERSYGSFCRVVPLPEGTITDSAKANFRNGVLEVVMQAPGREVKRGRRIEIGESAPKRNEPHQTNKS